MTEVFQNVNLVLRNSCPVFVVIGDNRTVAGGKEIRIQSARALAEIANSVGWRLVDSIPITVTTENRLHVKNSITENTILWFQKAA